MAGIIEKKGKILGTGTPPQMAGRCAHEEPFDGVHRQRSSTQKFITQRSVGVCAPREHQ